MVFLNKKRAMRLAESFDSRFPETDRLGDSWRRASFVPDSKATVTFSRPTFLGSKKVSIYKLLVVFPLKSSSSAKNVPTSAKVPGQVTAPGTLHPESEPRSPPLPSPRLELPPYPPVGDEAPKRHCKLPNGTLCPALSWSCCRLRNSRRSERKRRRSFEVLQLQIRRRPCSYEQKNSSHRKIAQHQSLAILSLRLPSLKQRYGGLVHGRQLGYLHARSLP
jgi:hypothetical protein